MQPQQYPQPYPQPGYAPQPQQGYPPQGQPYPQPAPQYAPAPQPQYAPQPAPAQSYGPPPAAYAPQNVPQSFDNPDPPSNVTRPRMSDFGHDGRLVIVSPKRIERGVPNRLDPKPGATQDRMTADVTILDGNAFPFGGAPEKGKPHTLLATIPYEIPAMYISNVGLISQCESRIDGHVLGRLRSVNLPNGQTAYRIDDPTDQDRAMAHQYVVDKMAGKFAAPAAPSTPGFGPQPQAPAQQPQYAPPQGDPHASQQYPPQQAYPAQGPPAQQLDVDTPPADYPYGVDAWRAMPPDQRAMILGAQQSRPGV